MKRFIVFGLLIGFLFSCSVLHIEKRHYRKGFHVSWNQNKIKNKEDLSDKLTRNSSVERSDEISISKHSVIDVDDHQKVLSSPEEKTLSDKRSIENTQSKSRLEVSKVRDKEVSLSTSDEVTHKSRSDQDLLGSNRSGTSSLFYFFLLGIVPVITLQRKRGYRLSKWASNNKRKSQALLGVSMTVAVGSSYGLGNLLQWDTSGLMLMVSGGIMVTSALFHLSKLRMDSSPTKNRFTISLLNVGATSLSFYAGSNTPSFINVLSDTSDPYLLHPSASIPIAIILSSVLVGVLYLIAIASCTIACNGFEIAAVFFLIGATYIAVFLAALGFYNLFRKESQKEKSFVGKAAVVALISIIAVGIFLLIVGSM